MIKSHVAALLGALLITACGLDSGESSDSLGTLPGEDPGAPTSVTAEESETTLALGNSGGRSVNTGHHHVQVVLFGDSLSDVGTYEVGPIAAAGGGKFTTNPGLIWPERIGRSLHVPVTPFRRGFGGVSQILGGTDFAMGGARISQQPGIDCHPDSQTGACTAALTIPVTEQIADYLVAHGDRFTEHQLVFLLAGANDLFFQLGEAWGR